MESNPHAEGSETERPLLTRIDPQKKVSDEQWKVIQALYCAGATATELAPRYGITPHYINKRASAEKWLTPRRMARAANLPATIDSDDPAEALTALWRERGEASRESVYQGSKKALDRFFAMAPVPQSFAEAAVAEKMLSKAIDPAEGKTPPTNVNLQILTGQGFTPRHVNPVDV